MMSPTMTYRYAAETHADKRKRKQLVRTMKMNTPYKRSNMKKKRRILYNERRRSNVFKIAEDSYC